MLGNDPDGYVRYICIASLVVTVWIVANIMFIASASSGDANLRLSGSVRSVVSAQAEITVVGDSGVLRLRGRSNITEGVKYWVSVPGETEPKRRSLRAGGAAEMNAASIPLNLENRPDGQTTGTVTLVIQSN